MAKENRLLKTIEFSCPETQKKIIGFVDTLIEKNHYTKHIAVYENLLLYAIAKLEDDQEAKDNTLFVLGKEFYDRKGVL